MAFITNTYSSALSDDQLIINYKATGNLDGLGILYSRYMELVYGVCLKYLKDRDNAKDAVFQVFEELVDKLKKHDPVNFRSWLYTVVKNYCLMQLRRQSPGNIVPFNGDIMQSAEEMHHEWINEKEIQLTLLSKCIDKLSSEQKKSVELFYLKDTCYKEIVSITGLELNKVRSLIQNGRRNLKICMEEKIKNVTSHS